MDYKIRPLELSEVEAASKLMWLSFYHSNKDHASSEGFEFFRDTTEKAVLQYEILYNELKLVGAFCGSELLGVCGFRLNRIILLFVSLNSQKKGVGKALLEYAINRLNGDVELDSSFSAITFYEKFGFEKSGELCSPNGILTQAMILKKDQKNPMLV